MEELMDQGLALVLGRDLVGYVDLHGIRIPSSYRILGHGRGPNDGDLGPHNV